MRTLAIALMMLTGVVLAVSGCMHMQDNASTTHQGSTAGSDPTGGGGGGGGGGGY
ncbi:MAG TPA: hypothetical protein VJY39_07755 [Acidisphaera sp.]|nr:hypothetical protein [Acidisphaera sp.]